MGRKRRKDKDLPAGMYRKHGAFWLVKGGKWTRLAALDDLAGALSRYAQLQRSDDDTVSGAISRYRVAELEKLSVRTQEDYGRSLAALDKWAGHMALDAIRPGDVVRYLRELRPPSAANRNISVLSAIYRAEIDAGRCDFNPCLGVRRHKQKQREYLPPPSEIAAIQRACGGPPFDNAIALALVTALRLGDMLALTRDDCTDEGLRARISKTGNVILFKWTPELKEIVDRCGDPVLIGNRKGKPYTVSGFESLWQRHKKAAGFAHVRWHDFRARALTDAHRARGLDYAQALAAHASAATTERYLRDRGEIVVELLR